MNADDAPGGGADGVGAARQRRVAASLRVGNPANHARVLATGADARLACPIELEVSAIRTYEHNPRRHTHPRYAEIKASIRASGVRNPITVTQRPGASHFIVEAGGNTRLTAVQELWAETADPRFAKLTVLFRPWRCESNVLIAHLIENEQRADLSFWDKACGIAALSAQLAREQERTLSLRQLEAELRQAGIAIGVATLNYYRFATDRLQILGEAVADLSGLDVAKLQPRLNGLRRYAHAHAAVAEDVCYQQLLEPVFRTHAAEYARSGVFRVDDLCRDAEAALARLVGEPVAQCREALALLARTPLSATAARAREPDLGTAAVVSPVAPATPAEPAVSTVQCLNSRTAAPLPAAAPSPAETGLAPAAVGPGACRLSDTVRQQLVAQLWDFARLAGVSDRLREAAAPLRLTADVWRPASGGDGPSTGPRWAGWLLALVCGQIRCTALAGGQRSAAAGDCGGDGLSGDAVAGAPAEAIIDLPFLLWLLDPHDAAAVAFRRVVALLAERAADPPEDGGPVCHETTIPAGA